MATLELKPVQINETITRVLPTQKTLFAVDDTAVLSLPATLFITSSEATTPAELTIESQDFDDKVFPCPLTGDYHVLYLGADIFGSKVKLVNSGVTGVFTAVVVKQG